MFLTLQMAVNTRRESSPPLYEYTSEQFLHYFQKSISIFWFDTGCTHITDLLVLRITHPLRLFVINLSRCVTVLRVQHFLLEFSTCICVWLRVQIPACHHPCVQPQPLCCHHSSYYNTRLWCTFLVTHDLPHLYPSICLSGEFTTRNRKVTTWRSIYTHRLLPRLRLCHRQIYIDRHNGFRGQSVRQIVRHLCHNDKIWQWRWWTQVLTRYM